MNEVRHDFRQFSAAQQSHDRLMQGNSLAVTAEWLSQLFLQPPRLEQLRCLRSPEGLAALIHVANCVNEPELAEKLHDLLNAQPIEDVQIALQRRHVELFEGVFNKRCLLPYASFWDGTGHLFGPATARMEALMRSLHVSLDRSCADAADHIGIQLALLAESLWQQRPALTAALLAEMAGWTDIFIRALQHRDMGGFYDQLSRFLAALLATAAEETAAMPPHAAQTNNISDRASDREQS